jgi:hypothetical protein
MIEVEQRSRPKAYIGITFVDVSDFDFNDVALSFESLVKLLRFGDVGLVLRVLLIDFAIS